MSKRGIVLVALACCVVPSAHAASKADTKAVAGGTRTLPGGAVLELSSDAKYELGRPIKLQLAPTGSDKTVVQVIKLSAGSVNVRIPEAKNPKTAVLIQAPRKVSAVAKGGESLVIVASDRVTLAAVQGEMLAALGNDWKPLPSGVVRSFAAGMAIEQPVPAAPQLSAQQTMLLALESGASASVQAAPNPNVERRSLALFRVEGAKRSAVSQSEWREGAHDVPNLAPGRYEVVARAFDRFGVQSPLSAPLTLRVVGVDLPEGARVRDGAIQLGRNGRARLIGAEGLESSYGRANVFVPAPKDVGLARGESTLLRLREPGTVRELAVKLEPRTLRAEVAIGPKTARWPGEALNVHVKLFDHQGKPVTDALKTPPRVFVNVEAVEPTWTHSGNTYATKVAPRTGSGPWVVRVEVSDDFGDQVGRDFLELGGG
jgi:hypothetical protein